MMTITVTLGLCVKDSESTIRDTVETIVRQDFPHDSMEVVVVDDGCSDRTIPIILSLVSETEIPVRVFSTGGKGLGTARQRVVDNARGKYIVWVDGDLTLSRDHVRSQVEFMESHPKAGKARGIWKQCARPTSLVNSLENMTLINYEARHANTRFAGSNLVGLGGSICRLQALRDAGGFDLEIEGAGEDVDIAAKMLKTGWYLCFSQAEFCHRFKETWSELWGQHLWYGYGAHYVSHKHRALTLVWTRTPLVSFFSGLSHSLAAYKSTYCKTSFLLPLQNVFKQTAWCFGFAKGHLRNYGHRSVQAPLK
jgi:glycosyltransferase involved in cell wall biosynthesis